jgi:hypothetical protein
MGAPPCIFDDILMGLFSGSNGILDVKKTD